MKNLGRYKKAVRAASKYTAVADTDRYTNPQGYKAALRHEQRFADLCEKADAILQELTPQEEAEAIDWLGQNSFYGFHDAVC